MRFITSTRTLSGRLRRTLAPVGALLVLVVGSAPVVAQEAGRSAAADWPTYTATSPERAIRRSTRSTRATSANCRRSGRTGSTPRTGSSKARPRRSSSSR